MDYRKMYINKTLVIGMILSGLLFGCNSGENVAKINGEDISLKQFDAYLALKRIALKGGDEREKVLKRYLDREGLALMIEKQALLDGNLMAAELNEFRKEMLINRYFEKYLQDKITDEAILNYYKQHAGDYETKKTHVAHILFRINKTMGDIERKAKLTVANEAYAKISADGDFSALAKVISEDMMSAKKGGDLGWLHEGAINEKFSKKIFSMKTGEVSQPFETDFGFHIIKIIDGPVAVKKSFEAVKGEIRYQLRKETKEAELARLMSEVKITQP